MRADIGAASLSIYGDPFDLDPFVDREDEAEAHAVSLLEAKRRGISRSALRSHQPVARPVTANLSSRRSVAIPQAGAVVEAAPVPDLLGSILTGQSMLLMDSSDVVINRDGSLKAAKPMIPSTMTPSIGKSSGDVGTLINAGVSPNLEDSSSSPHYNGNLPGSSHTSTNRLLNHNSSHEPSPISNHTQSTSHPDLLSRVHPSFQSPPSHRPTPPPCQRGTNGMRASREIGVPSAQTVQDATFKNQEISQSYSQPKKAPTKPMWVDVSVLPRIPKLKKENNDSNTPAVSSSGNRRSDTNSRSGSSASSVPEAAFTRLTGDNIRQKSVDQQKGQTQRQRPDGASSASGFSNSFSSSSSTVPPSQPQYSSSSSTAVSFRINSSGNSWHAKRLNIASSSAARGAIQEHWGEKEGETNKKKLRKDKQMLLSSRLQVSKEQDSNMYDPFNPTMSDSSSSDDEAKDTKGSDRPQCGAEERKNQCLDKKGSSELSRRDLLLVKTETQEVSQEQAGSSQSSVSSEVRPSGGVVKAEQESRLVDETSVFLDIKIKHEPKLEDTKKFEICDGSKNDLTSLLTETTAPPHHSPVQVKKEKKTQEGNGSGQCSGTPYRSPISHKAADTSHRLKEEAASDSTSSSRWDKSTDLEKKKASKILKEQPSSSSEAERRRREDRHASGQGNKKKEWEEDRSSKFIESKERRREPSSSDTSQSESPDRTHGKRQSQSRKRQSRSRSSSSSRERSRRKKQNQRSSERNYPRERDHKKGRVSKDKRRGRSRSRSRSRSRERMEDDHRQQDTSQSSGDKVKSRSKDKRRHKSRSSSREGKKQSGSSRNAQETSGTCVTSSKDTNLLRGRKKEKDAIGRNVEKIKGAKIIKQELPSCSFVHQVKKEDGDSPAENQETILEMTKIKNEKEIQEEKQLCLEMSEGCPIVSIKQDDPGEPSLASKNTDYVIDRPIKTQSCESTRNKTEPKSPELCPFLLIDSLSTSITAGAADALHETDSQTLLVSVDKQDNTVGGPVPAKQEPSNSDDDFSVVVMLDNLGCVKSEDAEESRTTVKKEKEVEDSKDVGEQVSSVLGTKSKTQVKRVTWNIQEPEGPQPDKSASKVALYKLKLKQEGVRRLSSVAQTPSQEMTGDASNASKKGTSSGSEVLHSRLLPTTGEGEAEEGDLSRKDKYLKKLHMQERAIEEVKLAIKPFYQRRDISKEEYKEILRKAVQKVCHSKSGEINPVKVGNLVKAYVDKYKHARKHKKGDDSAKVPLERTDPIIIDDSP